MNTFAAFLFFFWFLAPILYYSNVFFSKYLPISALISFDNTGLPYDPTQIIINGQFSVDAYKAYSPLFVPITLVLAYGISFASLTAVLTHTLCASIYCSLF